MNSFCKCEEPIIENEVKGSCLIVRCIKCAEEVVTSYWPEWVTDRSIYEIQIDPKENNKLAFVKLIKKKFELNSTDALNIFKNGRLLKLYKGTSVEIYHLIKELRDAGIKYKTFPRYPHKIEDS
jgi:hypothetical protein